MERLRKFYDVVLLANGAASDRSLGIPGEQLDGVFSARAFVNWYNGHPDYAHIGDLLRLQHVKEVVVVGHGNVALDCARILVADKSVLAPTDISP